MGHVTQVGAAKNRLIGIENSIDLAGAMALAQVDIAGFV